MNDTSSPDALTPSKFDSPFKIVRSSWRMLEFLGNTNIPTSARYVPVGNLVRLCKTNGICKMFSLTKNRASLTMITRSSVSDLIWGMSNANSLSPDGVGTVQSSENGDSVLLQRFLRMKAPMASESWIGAMNSSAVL